MPLALLRTFRRSFRQILMDEKDRLLLTCLQSGLPLISRPFEALATKIGTDAADLLMRIQRLKKEGILGGIRAMLDPHMFHYQSAWVAAKVDPAGQESCAQVLGQHPGVIYACEREHEFNLWFFIAVPGDQDLELHVRCLEKLAGAQPALFLPARRVFKRADFLNTADTATFPGISERFEGRGTVSDLSESDIVMIRKLQEVFPVTDEPFRKIASELRITEAQALEHIKSLAGKGCLKKIGSFAKLAAAPLAVKTLVVWQIPEEKTEWIGAKISELREVFSAETRPSYPEFPYSFYTLVRAATPAELEDVTRHVQERIGKWPHRVLATVRELKKEGIKYFPRELDLWWRQNRPLTETAFH